MPIYGYRCGSCGHQFETMQNVSSEPLKVCPECQGKLTKIMYAAGVIFKGSGFYSTDYKSAGKSDKSDSSNGSGSGSESSSPDAAKSEPKSEPKPKSESKPESKSESAD